MKPDQDVGRKAIVNGYVGAGVVQRAMGRTVDVLFSYGVVSTDRDKLVIVEEK